MIPSRQLNKHIFPEDIEGIFVEINLRKSKWLLFGTYHPPSQQDQYYFDFISRALDKYAEKYDTFLLAGDFNAEEHEACLGSFIFEYDAYCLVKDKTCFKNINNLSCIDLLITNKKFSFKNTTVISTGASDFHKMVITVLKTTFVKGKSKVVTYRDKKYFDNQKFREELSFALSGHIKSHDEFKDKFMHVLNENAPIKKKTLWANHKVCVKRFKKSNYEEIRT